MKRFLLVGDMPGWAFHQIISFVRAALSGSYDIYFDFTVYNPRAEGVLDPMEPNTAGSVLLGFRRRLRYPPIPGVRGLWYRAIAAANARGWIGHDADGLYRRVRSDNRYDVLVFLDWAMAVEGSFEHVRRRVTVKGIFSDGFPPLGPTHLVPGDPLTPAAFVGCFWGDSPVLLAGSPSIGARYAGLGPEVVFANLAYDERLFRPSAQRKAATRLVLGWTGNPDRAFKGYSDIIVPTVEALRKRGLDMSFRSRFEGPLDTLPAFWRGVDLAVIASQADAGPSMFMEAALCGVPSVSTRVGLPAYVIRDGHNGLFVERSVEDLSSAIERLYHERSLLNAMAAGIRSDFIEKLGHAAQVRNWNRLFQRALAN